MAENMIKFLRGNVASLPQTATAGAVYFTKDEGLYLGLEDGSYHRYGDFITVANVASLPESGAHETCMYYCESENILAKWDGSAWVQINKQKTLAELGGVAKSVYEAKIALLEKSDTDNATAIAGVDTRLQAAEEKLKSVATTEGLSELTKTVEGHTTAIDTINGDVNTAGSMLKIAKDAADGKDAAIEAAQSAADKAQGDVDTLAGTHATDKKALEDAIALKANAADVYSKDDIDGKVDTINAAIDLKANAADVYTKTEIDNKVSALEDADEAIEAKIGEVVEGKTVVKMIEEAQAAATYDDEEVRGLIGDNADAIAQEVSDREGAVSGLKTELEGKINAKVEQDAYDTKVAALEDEDERLAGLIGDNATDIAELGTEIDTLVGEDSGKSVRAIANEELAAQLIGENAKESLDTLQEIASWIQSHPDDASAMNDAIVALQTKVDTGDKTVSAYVSDAIAALSIGDYAKAADLTALAGRVSTLEGASATHATKDEVKAVSDALTEYKNAHTGDYDNDTIDAKVKGVQDQIDALGDTYATDAELTAAMEAEVARANGAYAGKAYESTVDTHIADEVAHITADERTAWNGAQAAAEATAAANLATARTEITAEIATAKGEAISDAEGKIATAKSDLEGKISTAKSEAIADAEGKVNAAKSELQGNIDTHTNNGDIHVTTADKEKWNAAQANAEKTASDALTAALTWGSF